MWELNSNIIEYLPDWFKQIADFEEICKTETEQFEALANAIHEVADNFFFKTMDEKAVNMWEQIFGIVPDYTVETLDFRRFRVLNRLTTKPPFTLGFLYQKLDEIIGVGAWTVTIDYPNYTLYIESSSENQQYYNEVLYTINKIKPAHIAYINKPFTTSAMTIDESVELSELEWNYRLSAWGLGINPFVTSKMKEVLVMPSQQSIQQQLLNSTAESVINIVNSARINGTTVINTLTKEARANKAVIQYKAKEAQAKTVTQIELLDINGNVLTTSGVYVPITDEAVFTHYLPIEEAITNG